MNGEERAFINEDALNSRLNELRVSKTSASMLIGKNPQYLSNILDKSKMRGAPIESISYIEDRLGMERGTLIKKQDDEERFADSIATNDTNEKIYELLRRTIKSTFYNPASDSYYKNYLFDCSMSNGEKHEEEMQLLKEIVKAIKETQAVNELLLQQILQKQKEICTAQCKLLAVWDVRTKKEN